jgi:SAM-dependent methyltransferase
MALFRKSEKTNASSAAARPSRSSSGWKDIHAYLEENPEQRVLDFGATSSSNINYLTGMGHSVYMAHAVQDAADPAWIRPVEEGPPQFDAEAFAAEAYGFSGRAFNVVLLWDTANYLPPSAVEPLFRRLHDVLLPGGRLLAFFHGASNGPQAAYGRYQISPTEQLSLLDGGNFAFQQVYQTRQIEKFLSGYASTRFFLGRDNIREVIAVR